MLLFRKPGADKTDVAYQSLQLASGYGRANSSASSNYGGGVDGAAAAAAAGDNVPPTKYVTINQPQQSHERALPPTTTETERALPAVVQPYQQYQTFQNASDNYAGFVHSVDI